MEYENFELKISANNNGQYSVSVLRSPAGEANAIISINTDGPKLRHILRLLEISSNSRKATKYTIENEHLTRAGRKESPKELELAKSIGLLLFEKIFVSEILSCLRISLQKVRDEDKGLRLLLRLDSQSLTNIPWEYLYDPVEDDFFTLSIERPIIRFLELSQSLKSLEIKPPIQILGIISSPKDLPALDVERERTQMMLATEHLVERGQIKMTWLENPTWRDLQIALRRGQYHLIHFIGHGSFEVDSQEGAIALVNEEGYTSIISASSLGRLLADHKTLKMVVLNSCEGAKSNTDNIFSSTGASLIKKGIPSVISMQYEITDKAALEFSRTFYETIADGLSIDFAIQESRKAISFSSSNSSEWGIPVLHLRTVNTNLFNVDYKDVLFPKPSSEDSKLNKEEIPTKPHADLQNNDGLLILRNKVFQYWIEGVFEPSISNNALIQLDLNTMPSMVDSPWGDIPIPEGHSINDVFDAVGRSLLILGEPGAGKTTMLLQLADLILKSYDDTSNPLPVVFNLSSWSYSKKKLSDWLVEELSSKYMIPKKFGKEWVNNQRLILFLDGLDEVGIEARDECVQAINTFLKQFSLTSTVVCSRLKEYIELGDKLSLNGAIRLRLLSKEKVIHYLDKSGSKYSNLKNLLLEDSSWLRLAETPFLLSLMMKTFEGNESNTLFVREDTESLEVKRKRLISAYIESQFRMARSTGAA
ncbi:MAG: CHAT domain-containing protein [Bacteroidota bacterium]